MGVSCIKLSMYDSFQVHSRSPTSLTVRGMHRMFKRQNIKAYGQKCLEGLSILAGLGRVTSQQCSDGPEERKESGIKGFDMYFKNGVKGAED